VIAAGLLFTALHYITPAHGTEPPQRPYSCRLLDDAKRQGAFGQCDARLAAAARVFARRRPAMSPLKLTPTTRKILQFIADGRRTGAHGDPGDIEWWKLATSVSRPPKRRLRRERDGTYRRA
jgi:hypothetical protein